MSARYTPMRNWHNRDRGWQHFRGDERYNTLVSIQVCDVKENRSGHVWDDGCHKVVIVNPFAPRPKDMPRSKTFIGETAWSQAERYANDALQWIIRYAREKY